MGYLLIQYDCNTPRRLSLADIQYMCSYLAHVINFCKRIKVILLCSSAAMAISAFGTLDKRASKRLNISTALFPVAFTIKIYPNFSSYSMLSLYRLAITSPD